MEERRKDKEDHTWPEEPCSSFREEMEKKMDRTRKKGDRRMYKPILDVCCGSKMFYFNKDNPDVLFMDCRQIEETLCDGRKLEVKPDIIADFRKIPFSDKSFSMVVFDPPHLLKVGEKSWLAKKYGKLNENWREDLKQGFSECMRVLKPEGTLIFKWNEEQIKLSEILKLFNEKPILGNKRAKTHWLVFMKKELSCYDCIWHSLNGGNCKGGKARCGQFVAEKE